MEWLSHSHLTIEVYEFVDSNDTMLLNSHNIQENWIPIQAAGRFITVPLDYTKILLTRLSENFPMILYDWIPLLYHANEPLRLSMDPDRIYDAILPSPQLILNKFSTDNDL